MSATSAGEASFDDRLEQSLKDIGIPPRPAILDQISAEMKRDDPDVKRLSVLIGTDVALSASLIKTANSPFFGTRGRVRSVSEALMALGLRLAGTAIAGIVLRRLFPSSPTMERFWDASASIARVSGWLVQQQSQIKVNADDAYTYGLFRDCGIPVLMIKFPAYAATLANANRDAGHSFTQVEEQFLPTNHAIVGCLLARSWWLPEELCLAIRYHHDEQRLANPSAGMLPKSLQLVAVGQLAEYLLQSRTGLSQTMEWEKLGPVCLQLLGLDADQLPELLIAATDVIDEA